jgi:hypothetical protein
VFTTASFKLTNTVGAPAIVVATAGTPQSQTVHATFYGTLQARVTDRFGNPVPNANVIFTAPASGPSGTFSGGLSTIAVVSNAQGYATSTAFTANTGAGTYAVTAAVNGVATAASFVLTNRPGAATAITAVLGTPQSAGIGKAFAIPLVVVATDLYHNPVPGVTVAFAAPTSGASGKFATTGSTYAYVATNASGVAIAPTFTANSLIGSYRITAAASGVFPAVTFSLTNTGVSMTVVLRSSALTTSAPAPLSKGPGGILALKRLAVWQKRLAQVRGIHS